MFSLPGLLGLFWLGPCTVTASVCVMLGFQTVFQERQVARGSRFQLAGMAILFIAIPLPLYLLRPSGGYTMSLMLSWFVSTIVITLCGLGWRTYLTRRTPEWWQMHLPRLSPDLLEQQMDLLRSYTEASFWSQVREEMVALRHDFHEVLMHDAVERQRFLCFLEEVLGLLQCQESWDLPELPAIPGVCTIALQMREHRKQKVLGMISLYRSSLELRRRQLAAAQAEVGRSSGALSTPRSFREHY